MHLSVKGQVLPIAQLGPDFLILRTPLEIPPIDAEISLSIDGNVRCWAVHLAKGIHPDRVKTAITSCKNGKS